MGRHREHDDATRAALLAAAEALLSEGPEAISVRRVADAAGTSTRAVYSVFGGKPGLLSALYRQSFDELTARILAVPTTDDPVGDLVGAGLAFRAHALAHPNLFRLVFERLVPDLDVAPEDRDVGAQAFTTLEARVRRCDLPGRRATEVAVQVHAACQGLASIELQGWFQLTRTDGASLWRDTLTALLHGLGTGPSAP